MRVFKKKTQTIKSRFFLATANRRRKKIGHIKKPAADDTFLIIMIKKDLVYESIENSFDIV